MLSQVDACSKPARLISGESNRSPVLSSLSALASKGAHFTRVGKRSKAPIDRGYQKYKVPLDNAIAHLAQGGSVGIVPGKSSGNIVAIDIDRDAQVRTQFDPKLSKTCRSWRDNAPDRERRFVRIIGKLPRSFRDHAAGLELIADRGHAVIVGTHQTGAEIKLDDAAIVEMTAEELMAILQPWRTSLTDKPPLSGQNHGATISKDPHEQLIQAIEAGTPGNRNAAAFVLACGLRDAGLTIEDAHAFIKQYQSSVGNSGNHFFTLKEALCTLQSAYSRPPRCTSPVDGVLDGLARAILAGAIDIPPNVRKTMLAVIEVMQYVGHVSDIALPVRTLVTKTGNSRSTVHEHLRCLCNRYRLLNRETPGNTTAAARFSLARLAQSNANSGQSLHGPELQQLSENGNSPVNQGCGVSAASLDHVAEVCRLLQTSALTVPRARIDVHLAEGANMVDWRFGPSAMAILLALVLQPLPTIARVAEAALLSARTVSRYMPSLVDSGLVQKSVNGYQLSPTWQEYANRFGPALITHGRLELRAKQICVERQHHHRHAGQVLCDEMRDTANTTVRRAESDERFWSAHCDEASRERREYGLTLGLEASAIPPITLSSSRRSRHCIQQPFSAAKAGRKVIPEGRDRQPNGTNAENA